MSLAVKQARFQARGDPGLFGSIGKFIGGAAKIVGGILPGPLGIAARFAGGLLAPTPTSMRQGFVGPPRPTSPAGRDLLAQQGRLNMFGGLAPAVAVAAAGQARGAGLACPKGMKPNKSDYFLKSGQFVPAGTRCVSIRYRNPLNPRAADRAISRLESAKKAVTRLNRITIRSKCPK